MASQSASFGEPKMVIMSVKSLELISGCSKYLSVINFGSGLLPPNSSACLGRLPKFHGKRAEGVAIMHARYQDLEIELKCLVTKITASPNARIASELVKDTQSCITKCEKLVKTLKKLVVESQASVDQKGMESLVSAMKQIDESETEIQTWSVRFGFSEEKAKRGAKRKVSDHRSLQSRTVAKTDLISMFSGFKIITIKRGVKNLI